MVTEDNDFGELVMRQHLPSAGVILLRLSGMARAQQPAYVAQMCEPGLAGDHQQGIRQSWARICSRRDSGLGATWQVGGETRQDVGSPARQARSRSLACLRSCSRLGERDGESIETSSFGRLLSAHAGKEEGSGHPGEEASGLGPFRGRVATGSHGRSMWREVWVCQAARAREKQRDMANRTRYAGADWRSFSILAGDARRRRPAPRPHHHTLGDRQLCSLTRPSRP